MRGKDFKVGINVEVSGVLFLCKVQACTQLAAGRADSFDDMVRLRKAS